MAITSPFPARPNPAYTRSALITVRQAPEAAGNGAGDDEGWAVALADPPGSAAESEAVDEALGTSVRVADVLLCDGATDGPNAVGAGPPDPGAGASTEVDAPPHAATNRAIEARAPTNLVPARRTTIRRHRIEGL
jgi:hypothetical protein